ncbi:MAG TPA: VOC family protein [bacterium]|jgi:hypothetical protein
MHDVTHVEIPTRDLARAKRFYGKLFGWQFRDFDPGYALFDPKKGVGGGIYKVKSIPTKSPVRVYVGVANIDDTLKQVRAGGGKVLQPKAQVPGMGWYASFRDPQGAELWLWQRAPRRRKR